MLPCESRVQVDQWKSDLSTGSPMSVLPRVQKSSHVHIGEHRACAVSRTVAAALVDIDEGLRYAQDFWMKFADNVKAFCIGDRGVSKSMQLIWESASVAFNLRDILESAQPEEKHENAVKQLYSKLLPSLKRRPWPPDSYQASPERKEWPKATAIQVFYRKWWSNIYKIAHTRELPFYSRWRRVKFLEVEPLRDPVLLIQLVRQRVLRKKFKDINAQGRLIAWRSAGYSRTRDFKKLALL